MRAPKACMRLAATAVAWALAAAPGAQERAPAASLTLEDAIAQALRTNRTLESAGGRLTVQRGALDVAEDRYRPRATIGAATTAQNGDDTHTELSVGPMMRVPGGGQVALRWAEPVGGDDERDGGWRATFSQPLLRGGGAVDSASLRIARLRDEAALLAFEARLTETVQEVIAAYRALARAERTIAIEAASLERAERQLEVNRALIAAGQMAAREEAQSEAEIARRALSLVESEHEVSIERAGLLSILDIDESREIRTVTEPDPARSVPDARAVFETALARRTDYRRALIDAEVAAIGVETAKDATRWDLTLSAELARDGAGASDASARLALSIPIGDRRPTLALAEARQDVREAGIEKVERRESIRVEVDEAVRSLAIAMRRAELAAESLSLARRQREIEQAKLTQGLTTTFQLAGVEDDLVRAERSALDARSAVLDAHARLDRALGTTLERWGIDPTTGVRGVPPADGVRNETVE